MEWDREKTLLGGRHVSTFTNSVGCTVVSPGFWSLQLCQPWHLALSSSTPSPCLLLVFFLSPPRTPQRLRAVMEEAGEPVPYRHLALVADWMTMTGQLQGFATLMAAHGPFARACSQVGCGAELRLAALLCAVLSCDVLHYSVLFCAMLCCALP